MLIRDVWCAYHLWRKSFRNGWAIPSLQWKDKIKRRVFTFSVKPTWIDHLKLLFAGNSRKNSKKLKRTCKNIVLLINMFIVNGYIWREILASFSIEIHVQRWLIATQTCAQKQYFGIFLNQNCCSSLIRGPCKETEDVTMMLAHLPWSGYAKVHNLLNTQASIQMDDSKWFHGYL